VSYNATHVQLIKFSVVYIQNLTGIYDNRKKN